MARRAIHKLSAKFVNKVTEPGAYEDGGGLRLVVEPSADEDEPCGSKHWVVRVSINGRRVNRGGGGFPDVSLEAAREKAARARQGAREGRDVLGEDRGATKASDGLTTLREAFDAYFELKRKGHKSKKHTAQWPSTLETYVFPTLGKKPVDAITSSDVIHCLKGIWKDKHETASRVQQRLRAVMESHAVRTNSTHALPWTGILKELNSSLTKFDTEVEHHRSMPWRDVPKFYKLLCKRNAISRFCLRWAILTACRSIEARGARWDEIDEKNKLWSMPPQRMKAGNLHRVPLSKECMKLLKELKAFDLGGDLLFPSPNSGGVMSDNALMKLVSDLGYEEVATAHGFRTSFKQWATDNGVDDMVSEKAIAHKDDNKVRAAYLRSDMLDARKPVMEKWGLYVSKP
jgi:integrase